MSKIVNIKNLSEQLCLLEIKLSGTIDNPLPGQYIVLHSNPTDTGIALPVLKTNSSRETISVMLTSDAERQEELKSTESKLWLEGPFGKPFQTGQFGSVLCVSGLESMIPIYPVLAALRASGNHISYILTGSAGQDLILENEIRTISDNFISRDAACPRRTSQMMQQALSSRKFDQVFVIGSAQTIRDAFTVRTVSNIPVQAMLYLKGEAQKSLHGIFRVNVCANASALCVDGHNFNAFYAGFDDLVRRFPDQPTIGQTRKILSLQF
jgi:NAD(P)H-flavin reductase